MLHVPSSSDHVYCNGGSAVLQSWECSNLVQNLQNISPQWSRGHCASETSAATVVLIVQFPRCSDSPNMGWHILTTQPQWWRHLLPITTLRNYNLLNKRDIYPGEKYCEYEHSIQHRSYTAEGMGRSCSINAQCTCVWLEELCPTAAWGLSEISWTCDQAPPAASFTRWLPRTRL